MKSNRFTSIAFVVTWAGLLVGYWPSGCAQTMAGTGVNGTPAPASPEVVAQPAPGSPAPNAPGRTTILPHPAFALAQAAAGDQQVTIADIAERATPSVVNVASRRTVKDRGEQDEMFRFFFGPRGGEPQEREQRGLGSGVIYTKDGLVLTNNHVIEGADEITVQTADGTDYPAELVGTDEKSDVAVLRLKGQVKNLVPIKVGDSTALRVGDVVLAIGNPFGFSQTVTMGIVSAKGRSETRIVDYADFIQTDAAINPGNSGGALVNMQGELVGINTAIISRSGGYQGIGFAIPSNMASQIAQSLVTNGRVVRGWLGIGIQDVDPDMAALMNLPTADGVVVSDVEPGSPAEKGGLARGDVILTVDGRKTNTSAQLRNLIAEAGANKKVELAILRGGKAQTLSVLLGELKSDKPEAAKGGDNSRPETLQGLSVDAITPRIREQLSLPPTIKQGIVVTGVAPGSMAASGGLEPGDVILELNRQPIANVQQFRQAYQKPGGKSVLLLVYREGRTRYVVLGR
jgi:serine protease Do